MHALLIPHNMNPTEQTTPSHGPKEQVQTHGRSRAEPPNRRDVQMNSNTRVTERGKKRKKDATECVELLQKYTKEKKTEREWKWGFSAMFLLAAQLILAYASFFWIPVQNHLLNYTQLPGFQVFCFRVYAMSNWDSIPTWSLLWLMKSYCTATLHDNQNVHAAFFDPITSPKACKVDPSLHSSFKTCAWR